MPSQYFRQLRNKAFFVLRDSSLHFSPSIWTILVLYTYDAVNDTVDFSFVLTRDLYSNFLENMLNMPKIASHNKSPQQVIALATTNFSCVSFSLFYRASVSSLAFCESPRVSVWGCPFLESKCPFFPLVAPMDIVSPSSGVIGHRGSRG